MITSNEFSQILLKVAEEVTGKPCKTWHSEEAEQDYLFYNSHLCSIRTSEPSPIEIKEWENYNKLFNNLNIDEVKNKYKIQFLEQEKPYQDYDW